MACDALKWSHLIPLSLLLLSTDQAAAQKQLILSGEPLSEEVRHTAHRLSVSEERLITGRIALDRATGLATTTPIQNSYSELGSVWTQLDRKNAKDVILDLLRHLEDAALQAEEPNQYESLRAIATNLNGSLRQLDPELSEAVLQDFPAPGPNATRPADQGSGTTVMCGNSLWGEAYAEAATDPLRAIELLLETERENFSFAGRTGLVRTLRSHQFIKEASVLWNTTLDQMVDMDTSSLGYLGQVANTTAELQPDRLPEVFEMWSRFLDAQPSPRTDQSWIRADVEILRENISSHEREVLDTLKSWTRSRPWLANTALEYFPTMQQMLEPFGGISDFARAEQEWFGRNQKAEQERMRATHEALARDSSLPMKELSPSSAAEISQLLRNASRFHDDPLYGEIRPRPTSMISSVTSFW